MSKWIQCTIDTVKCKVRDGATVLDAARACGIEIPTLCHDGRVDVFGACGLCVVEQIGSTKLIRSCSTPVTEGMEIVTDTPRVLSSRKCALELLLSDHTGDCRAPCMLACPAGTDCQGYVGLIANREYIESARLIKKILPFPASIGRVCPHPCETACRRALVEQPVAIAALKRFAGDYILFNQPDTPAIPPPPSGKRVAVIGGGPGGLTAAWFLAKSGHKIRVYDMMPQMGGMLRYGIPEYRLPKKILDMEIEPIRKIGVEFINGVKIGADITLEEIRNGHDAVVVATGAWQSTKMNIPGEELQGVIGGIDFLRNVALGTSEVEGRRVAVCGGGNTAMDACRTAVRLGAKEVHVIYRRTRKEMPAEENEIEEAEEEGVVFRFLSNPVEVKGNADTVAGLQLQKMKLGEPDAGGRRRPVPIDGAYEFLEADMVIIAIGQSNENTGLETLEKTKYNTIAADASSFRTSLPGVFAVGDATNAGADIAIAAIGEAEKASKVIDAYLRGSQAVYREPQYVKRSVYAQDYADVEKVPRSSYQVAEPESRKSCFDEVVSAFTEADAVAEASRCLECGCQDFFECKLLNYSLRMEASPESYAGSKRSAQSVRSRELLEYNEGKCILCGLCVRVCAQQLGISALGLVGRGFETVIAPEFRRPLDTTGCIYCGQCAALCPTGALREVYPGVKNVPLEEEAVHSVCDGCAALCGVEYRFAGKTVNRVLPAPGTPALCPQGRFGFSAELAKLGATAAVKTADGNIIEIRTENALKAVADRLKGMSADGRDRQRAVLISERITAQEARAAVLFARFALGTQRVYAFADCSKPLIGAQNIPLREETVSRLFSGAFYESASCWFLREKLGVGRFRLEDAERFDTVVFIGGHPDAPYPPCSFKAVLAADRPDNDFDIFIPLCPAPAKDGVFLRSDGSQAMMRSIPTLAGPDNAQVIRKLAECLAGRPLPEFDDIDKAVLEN